MTGLRNIMFVEKNDEGGQGHWDVQVILTLTFMYEIIYKKNEEVGKKETMQYRALLWWKNRANCQPVGANNPSVSHTLLQCLFRMSSLLRALYHIQIRQIALVTWQNVTSGVLTFRRKPMGKRAIGTVAVKKREAIRYERTARSCRAALNIEDK